MKKRFELEQEILDCWGIVDDIDILLSGIKDKEIPINNISNILIGLRDLYTLRFEKVLETLKEGINK
jgi:hypothetical protein